MTIVYIGLGSNLDDPARQLQVAVAALKRLPDSRYLGDSGLFLSRALTLPDSASQPDYCNAVAAVETGLSPHALLDRLQSVEKARGRERAQRWAARTLDLDILLYGDRIIDDERLQIPHPEMTKRAFVLYPLQRIAPAIEIPGHGKLENILAGCPSDGLQYLGTIETPDETGRHDRDR